MNDARKLAFVAHQTAQALNHAAKTPNTMAADGGMSHDKMLKFVQQVTKHGLQHFDDGGTVLSGPSGTRNPGATVNNTGLVGSIGDALNLNNNFQAQAAPIQEGTNAAQLNQAYQGVQGGLQQQQGIANTLTPGVGQAAGAQSWLSGQLQAQAQGAGLNPAQQQFKQNANQLAAQQSGAIASAKGISPALQARMIAQQGASAGQNIAGQAATLQAQQQLAAQNNLQNLSANQVAQGSQAVQGVNNAQQNEQNILQNANSAYNNAQVSQQANLNNVNAGVAGQNQQQAGNIVSGITSAVSSLGGLFAGGGEVKSPKMYAEGGLADSPTSGPQSYVGQWLNSSGSTIAAPQIEAAPQFSKPTIPSGESKAKTPKAPGVDAGQGMDTVMAGGAGDAIPDIGGAAVMAAAKGGLMKKGGNVAAKNSKEKAVKSGDSLDNDKVPAMLSEGEIVIPRHITMSDRAPEKAAAFVAHVLAKKRMIK